MKSFSKFRRNLQKRSTFRCAVCKRLTREVGSGNSGVDLCSPCFELSGIENDINDGNCTLADRITVIRKHVADIASKGGDVSDWQATFSL